MMTFIFIILGLGFCFFVALMFSLVKAGRRADIGEEKILDMLDYQSNFGTYLRTTVSLIPRAKML